MATTSRRRRTSTWRRNRLDADSNGVRYHHEKVFVGERHDNTSDQIVLVKVLGTFVKVKGPPRSLDLLLQMLVPAQSRRRTGCFSYESKLQEPLSQFERDWLQLFNDPICWRWLFEARRLVNQRVIDVWSGLRILSR